MSKRLSIHSVTKYGYDAAKYLDNLWYSWLNNNRLAEYASYENTILNQMAEDSYGKYESAKRVADFQSSNKPLFEHKNRHKGADWA